MMAELESALPYSVPEGYFASFPVFMLAIINNEKFSGDSIDQVEIMPSFFKKEKVLPFSVPDQYFDTLAEDLLRKVKQIEENPKEELKNISPLLAGLEKINPFTLPDHYFETLQPGVVEKPKSEPARIFALGTWKRFAAAAVFAGIILSTVVFYLNNTASSVDSSTKMAVSEKALEDFLLDDNLEIITEPLIEDANNTMVLLDINENTIHEMLLTVDDKAIKEFMNENPEADISNQMN